MLLRNVCIPKSPANKTYKDLIGILGEQFKSVKSYFAERLKVYRAKKEAQETIAEWSARVKTLASTCGFGTELNVVMRDAFVIGLGQGAIMEKLFEENASDASVTLAKVCKIAMAKESALHDKQKSKEVKDGFPSSSSDNTICGYVKMRPGHPSSSLQQPTGRSAGSKNHREKGNSGTSSARMGESSNGKCRCCGTKNHNSGECRYRNYSCHKLWQKRSFSTGM